MVYGIAGLVVLAVIFGGLDIFWNLLDLFQLFSYLQYINVEYPYNLQVFFGAFSFA
jgi:hypothetical protein